MLVRFLSMAHGRAFGGFVFPFEHDSRQVGELLCRTEAGTLLPLPSRATTVVMRAVSTTTLETATDVVYQGDT